MKRRNFLAAAAASALATTATAMPTKLPDELCPDLGPLPQATVHQLQAAHRIKDGILKYAAQLRRLPPPPRPRSWVHTIMFGWQPPEHRVPPIDMETPPPLPAAALLNAAANDRPSHDLLEMGIRYAMVEMLPRRAYPTPFPVGGVTAKPVRITTPRYVWDVEEGMEDQRYAHRAMQAITDMASTPPLAVRDQVKRCSEPVAVSPLRIHVKLEAFMIEVMAWCLCVPRSAIKYDATPLPENVAVSNETRLKSLGLDYKKEQRHMLAEKRLG